MAQITHVFHFLLLSHLMLLLLAAGDGNGNGYQGECPPSFDCGLYLRNISFPFTVPQRPHCGSFVIHNCDDPLNLKFIQLQNNGTMFRVIRFVPNPLTPATTTIQIRDQNLYDLHQSKSCEAFSHNYTLPSTFPFGSISIQYSHTLFKCNRTLHVNPPPEHVHNYTKCPDYDLYYKSSTTPHDESLSSLTACTKVQLPVKDVADANDPFTFITSNVLTEVHLTDECANCYYHKRGQCQLDSRQRFVCTFGYGKHSCATHKFWNTANSLSADV
ncbi:hypothetical protein RIF29_22537 [Crotalaria pallida]|uniref:Uncharacterized protein n=1 Tax=Crotalaria pallida TaxID=3830 RepID=A0AAN9IAG2_CROPI